MTSTTSNGGGTTNHSPRDIKAVRDPELAKAEAEIERTRARVVESVMALRNEVVRRTDWRGWIGRRPGLFLAGAFAAGFLLSFRRSAGVSHKKIGRRWSWR